MNNPMKAYQVRDRSEGYCTISFATNGATARREGASELGRSFEEVESCARAPWADQYAPGPVPLQAYLANGWWFECSHCGVRFDEDGRHGDGDDDRNDEFQPIEDGKAKYCSPTCKMEHWAEKRQRTSRQLAAIEAVLTHWPMATGVTADECSKPWPSRDYEMRAQFTLPCVRYPVNWVPGAGEVFVSQCDAEDFKRLYGRPEAA